MNCINRWITPTVRQIWVSLPAFLTKTGGGMTLGFTSCLLTAIQNPESDIKMDLSTFSWFVSSVGISLNFGFLMAACAMRFGRRISLIINSIPAIIGQLLIYSATDVTTLIIGRVFTGAATGSNLLIGIVMIGECTSPQNRGMFLNMTTLSLNVGSLMMHLIGYYTSWRNLALVITLPYMLSSFFAYISPDSPSWLAEKKKFEKSRQSFYCLRGKTEDSTREIEELILAQKQKKINKTLTEHLKDFVRKFKKQNFLKPVWIYLVAIILLEATGRHILPSYASGILQEMMSDGVDTHYTNIALDLLVIVSGVAASYLVRVMNVRTLLFTSGAATLVVLYSACLVMYLVKNGIIPEVCSWGSVVLFGLFFVLSNLGCTCLPFIVSGEIYPLEHRVVASVVAHTLSTCVLTFFLKSYPLMVVAFETHGAFAILGVCMIVALFVLYFILPETKNRTLLEIEEYFNNGKYRDDGTEQEDALEELNKTVC